MYIYSIYLYRIMLVYPLQPNGLLKHLISGYSNCCINNALLFSAMSCVIYSQSVRWWKWATVGCLPHHLSLGNTEDTVEPLPPSYSFHCTHLLVGECNKNQNIQSEPLVVGRKQVSACACLCHCLCVLTFNRYSKCFVCPLQRKCCIECIRLSANLTLYWLQEKYDQNKV